MAIMSMFGFSLIAILLVGILGALLGSLFFAGMNSRHNNNDDTNPSTQQQNNQPTQQVAGVPSPRTQSPQARRTSAPPPASQPELIPHPSLDTSPLPALQNPIRASA
ncbi:MAG: hypothetical protein HY094_08560 [Candidatus Melainabacteria bacterium]|nr:hypothetical protein [Candidatus Melainabacteria bacterium]